MKTKKVLFTELAYALGIVILALGTAFMEKANLGMSMVVAPAYLLHLKISQFFPAFTFGMAEYVFQALLIIALCFVMKKAKLSYLFSFVTAVIYGFTLDLAMLLIRPLAAEGLALRIALYLLGMVLGSIGVAFLFHTYIAPEAYELFVKELSAKHGLRIDRVKTVYDLCSCLLAIILSFAFFGLWHFEGVKLGTVFCALINGFMIGLFNKMLEAIFEFKDAFKLRELFNK